VHIAYRISHIAYLSGSACRSAYRSGIVGGSGSGTSGSGSGSGGGSGGTNKNEYLKIDYNSSKN